MPSPTARWVGVPGTWAYHSDTDPQWWAPDSPLSTHLRDFGFIPLSNEPFIWSTDVNGALFDVFRSKAAKHSDWKAAGAALAYYLKRVPVKDRNIISHSHGLQVVLYACARHDLRINTLIDVSGPVRKDLKDVAAQARPRIGYWTHICSDDSDRTQILGSWFDGMFGNIRKHPYADLNVCIPKVGHSKILNEPEHFQDWDGLIVPAFTVQPEGKIPYGAKF